MTMKILVTAGNTQTPIDQVRCITNIFSGRTGAQIALESRQRGHLVTLVTSQPQALVELTGGVMPEGVATLPYRTFDELRDLLQTMCQPGKNAHDAIVFAAAVSDYAVAGAYVPALGTSFDPTKGGWVSSRGEPTLLNTAAGKLKSQYSELWLRLQPAPKLVDMVRRDWGFRGILVKFKLEVGVEEAKLLEIAEHARLQSDANLMVANTLQGMHAWAFVGPIAGEYRRVSRQELPATLLLAIEELHKKG